MGRELQKKKRRSGRNPVRRHSKKPKAQGQILSNPYIKANWDNNETLTQNYRRLGLISKLNKQTGGAQIRSNEDASLAERPFEITPGTTYTQKPISEVVLEKDSITGESRIVSQHIKKPNPLNDLLNELDDNEDDDNDNNDNNDNNENINNDIEQIHQIQIQNSSLGHVGTKVAASEFVKKLEEEASLGIKKRPRQQSEREREWISLLIEKHGYDYSAMFKDKKLNPMQQSIGDLKKRVNKWKSKRLS